MDERNALDSRVIIRKAIQLLFSAGNGDKKVAKWKTKKKAEKQNEKWKIAKNRNIQCGRRRRHKYVIKILIIY